MRYRFILVLILFPVFLCSSQRLKVLTYRMAPGDSTKPVRSTHQYLGVQANQLLNQLLSLGNNNAVVTNPYLIIYSVNSARTGVGLNMGLGYTVHSTDDKSDPNTTRSTTISSFSTRVGVEKKSLLTKKWQASYGFDLLYNNEDDHTSSSSKFQFNSNSSDSNSNTSYFGFGPRVALNFFITEKILLGTEVTYYFKSIKVSQKITNTSTSVTIDPTTGQQSSQTSSSTIDTSQKATDFALKVPVALFLMLKF